MVSSNTRKWRSKALVLRVHHTHSQNHKHVDRLEYDYRHMGCHDRIRTHANRVATKFVGMEKAGSAKRDVN